MCSSPPVESENDDSHENDGQADQDGDQEIEIHLETCTRNVDLASIINDIRILATDLESYQ